MSAFDPSDPFDNGQPWQNVPSTQPVWPTLDQEDLNLSTPVLTPTPTPAPAPVVQPIPQTTATSFLSGSAQAPAQAPVQASAPPQAHTSTTHSITEAVTSLFHRHSQENPAPAVAGGSSSTSSTPTPGLTAQKSKTAGKNAILGDEEEPPSYESSVIRNVTTIPHQIHDNYDHLRGPPGQRGVDIKTRIPLDSTPAEHFQSGSGSGSNAGGSGSQQQPPRQYGATTHSDASAPPTNSSSSAASSAATATRPFQGQPSHGRSDDDAQHSRDVDRLLGPNSSTHGNNARPNDEEEEPKTHWSIVGDGKAWTAFFYILFIVVPLSLFFFVWSMATLIISAVSMIFPPVGYFVVIATVTSWRALGRLDLVLSRALVPKDVRERHPYLTFDIFVTPGSEECAHHGIHSSTSSTSPPPTNATGAPPTSSSASETYTTAEGEVRQRRRKPRNVFDKSATHLSASFSNKHTLKTLSYLLIWKLVLAVPIFCIVVVFACLTLPLIFCLLPSLLIICRAFVHWQFRWAIIWLAERHKPIALP
ncbi:hypothetical protein BG015_004098 [Linnemannia schmuckeri]|uniref:Transmembrane protein n=1 Tax=Linnemannia schmuckeri TaxID=64567 RepID=A0A9P5S1S2_9FUNG|nr:hypothetical protein BG015_004098 [Linnemannia schmuckeri]